MHDKLGIKELSVYEQYLILPERKYEKRAFLYGNVFL